MRWNINCVEVHFIIIIIIEHSRHRIIIYTWFAAGYRSAGIDLTVLCVKREKALADFVSRKGYTGRKFQRADRPWLYRCCFRDRDGFLR